MQRSSLLSVIRAFGPSFLARRVSALPRETGQPPLRLQKVLVLSKMTRYEYEKMKSRGCTEMQLKRELLEKGSDYDGLLQRHNRHVESLNNMVASLRARGIETKVIGRRELTPRDLSWADTLLSAGGDGTFLLGASKIKNSALPIIGVNTDPERSEGYLCLPRKFSANFSVALDRLLAGDFRWLWRRRIRVAMSGRQPLGDAVELLEQQLQQPEQRFIEHVREHELHSRSNGGSGDSSSSGNIRSATWRQKQQLPVHTPWGPATPDRVASSDEPREYILPTLALNDVFIGESLSARVSYYELSKDGSAQVKMKSSGLTVCTGTGSSSWHFNINYMHRQDVKEVLRIAEDACKLGIPVEDSQLVESVASRFNSDLCYDPSDLKMAYCVRDPVMNGTFQVAQPRGYASRLVVRSRMWDACLVIDGGVSFQFNDGAVATLEMHEEDSLRTVILD